MYRVASSSIFDTYDKSSVVILEVEVVVLDQRDHAVVITEVPADTPRVEGTLCHQHLGLCPPSWPHSCPRCLPLYIPRVHHEAL